MVLLQVTPGNIFRKATALLLSLLFVGTVASAQGIIWLHRGWKAPAESGDSVSFTRLQNGWFPLYRSDVPGVIGALEDLVKMVNGNVRAAVAEGALQVGSTEIYKRPGEKGRRAPQFYLRTYCGAYSTELMILGKGMSPVQATRRISKMLDYIRNNSAVLPERSSIAGGGNQFPETVQK